MPTTSKIYQVDSFIRTLFLVRSLEQIDGIRTMKKISLLLLALCFANSASKGRISQS